MSLQATIQAAALLAFRAAGDIVAARRVRHTPTQSYNASTDAMTVTWGFNADVDVVGYDEESSDTEGQDNPDLRLRTFCFLASALPVPITATVEVDDQGITWKSYKIERDPAGATVLIYCRA